MAHFSAATRSMSICGCAVIALLTGYSRRSNLELIEVTSCFLRKAPGLIPVNIGDKHHKPFK